MPPCLRIQRRRFMPRTSYGLEIFVAEINVAFFAVPVSVQDFCSLALGPVMR